MNIIINGKLISSLTTPNHETAWPIEDAECVLKYIAAHHRIILGGDILKSDLTYCYDNWYYNIDNSKGRDENSEASTAIAQEYILNYIRKNGTDHYVVIVAD